MSVKQGDILKIEKIRYPVLVVSKNFFNRTEQIIGCPVAGAAKADPLHMSVHTEDIDGIILCEQMKLLDLRIRGYKKISEVQIFDIMNITDAIQGIFDHT